MPSASDERIAQRLRAAIGFDDVSDIISVLRSLPPTELRPYLSDFLGEGEHADAIAAELLGSVAPPPAPAPAAARTAQATGGAADGQWRRKAVADEVDNPFARGTKQHQQQAPAAAPVSAAPCVGGVSVSKGKSKKGGGGSGLSSLASLDSALRPGRHLCRCAARTHKLLYNCLACGKIVCVQVILASDWSIHVT